MIWLCWPATSTFKQVGGGGGGGGGRGGGGGGRGGGRGERDREGGIEDLFFDIRRMIKIHQSHN